MLKRTAFVVALCACVGTAHGAAKKIRSFTPSTAQVDESVAALGAQADPDGMAILNYAAGADKTIVQIIVSDMTPNLTYSLRLTDGSSEEIVNAAITTDEDGHGNFHQEFPNRNISTWDVELFVGTTAGGVVWSQLQDPANLAVPYANTSLDTTGNAADNFEFGAVTEIASIRWWGIWCNADPLADEFRVRFYNDNGGLPDTTAGSTFVEMNVIPTQTVVGAPLVPICTYDPEEELEFEAVLTTPFTAAANTTYWIEIVSKQTAGNQIFVWANANSSESRATPDGDGAGAQRNTPTGSWITQPDRAFELIGEVDATEVRASGTNPG